MQKQSPRLVPVPGVHASMPFGLRMTSNWLHLKRNALPMTPSAKVHRVFFIPEILEAILLCLPALYLRVRCIGVCKTWKTLIESSPSLQYYMKAGYHPSGGGPISRPPYSITPFAIEFLGLFWEKLAPHAITHEQRNAKLTVKARAYRQNLRVMIESLFNRFRPICDQIPFLDSGYQIGAHSSSIQSNWVEVGCTNEERITYNAIFESQPSTEQGGLPDILESLCYMIYYYSPSAIYKKEPDTWAPVEVRIPSGENERRGVVIYRAVIIDLAARQLGHLDFKSTNVLNFGSYEPFPVKVDDPYTVYEGLVD